MTTTITTITGTWAIIVASTVTKYSVSNIKDFAVYFLFASSDPSATAEGVPLLNGEGFNESFAVGDDLYFRTDEVLGVAKIQVTK